MRVLVCGDRNWRSRARILGVLVRLKVTHPDAEIIHGDCRGADRLAGGCAAELGLTVHAVPAEWEKHGKAAGPLRNQRMLDEYAPDMVLAFHPNIEASRGTADMVRRAERAGIPTYVLR